VEWSDSELAKGGTQQTVTHDLGRVIDVPLTVTLRFGQRNMRLRDVLELNTGALVELDRQVEDPVDLILDERVIARGEVVIVDGNYGLRVTEIVERPSTVVP
jgi:flagellar motor switch protein FliN/FliY